MSNLLPVSSTRTSTPLTAQRLLTQLHTDQIGLQRQFDMLSTGRRVLSLSDDAAAAGRALSLTRGIDHGTQLLRNANSTRAHYDATDTALNKVNTAVIQARAAAVEGAQSFISGDERAAIEATLAEAIATVTAAGNNLYRDQQVLGGVLNRGPAFETEGAEVLYVGQRAVAQTQLGAGTASPVNVDANAALGAASVFLDGESLGAGLNRETRLVDVRGGEGVTPGVIRLSGGSNWIDVDLRDASTMGDVIDLLDGIELEGRAILASLSSDEIRLEYADGLAGTMAIDDATGSTIARDLSIANPQGTAAPPIVGDRLSPRVTLATRIDDLNGGAGLNLADGLQIIQGEKTFVVDVSNAETLGQVMIEINRSGADVLAELNLEKGGLRLRGLRSGVDYSIGENGGITAEQLGIRTATRDTMLRDLGRGIGVSLNLNDVDLTIVRPDGLELELELESVETIQDVITLIRTHPNNQDTRRVLVDLNDFGNGLQLKAPPGAQPLTIRQGGISDAGVRLGLIPRGENQSFGELIGSVSTIVGADYAPRDAGGTLDTLLRMRTAIRDADYPEIERMQAKLDVDFDRASRIRGKVGVWTRNLDQLVDSTEQNLISLEAQRSEEIDADMATVISDLSQRQLSLEASMRSIGETVRMTVLNYL